MSLTLKFSISITIIDLMDPSMTKSTEKLFDVGKTSFYLIRIYVNATAYTLPVMVHETSNT